MSDQITDWNTFRELSTAALEAALDAGSVCPLIRSAENTTLVVSMMDGVPAVNRRSSSGTGIYCIENGGLSGFASSAGFNINGVIRAAREAANSAKALKSVWNFPSEGLKPDEVLPHLWKKSLGTYKGNYCQKAYVIENSERNTKDISCFDSDFMQNFLEKMDQEILNRVEEISGSDVKCRRELSLSIITSNKLLTSSFFDELSFSRPVMGLSAKVTVYKNGNAQSGSVENWWGFEEGNEIDAELQNMAEKVLMLAEDNARPREKSRLYPEIESLDVILSPFCACIMLHETLGHSLELDRILGWEKGLAGGSPFRIEDRGKRRIGFDSLNVISDPGSLVSPNGAPYDDEGMTATKKHLVKAGIIESFIGTATTFLRTGIEDVGSARGAGFTGAPITRMTWVGIEPDSNGHSDWREISKNSIYLDGLKCWSVDQNREGYSLVFEAGLINSDKHKAMCIENIEIRADSLSTWKMLTEIGNAETFENWGVARCGKGEPLQISMVGHGSPTLKFKGLGKYIVKGKS